MTYVNKAELRRLAEAATDGKWVTDGEEIGPSGNVVGAYVAHEDGGRIGQAFSNCLVPSAEKCTANAAFIAAANPSVVRSLLDEIEALQGLYRMHQQTETREMLDLKAERDQLRSGAEALRAKADCVDDCAYLIRKLVHCRRQLAIDDGLAEKALDYLKRKGLQGIPMRGKESPDD